MWVRGSKTLGHPLLPGYCPDYAQGVGLEAVPIWEPGACRVRISATRLPHWVLKVALTLRILSIILLIFAGVNNFKYEGGAIMTLCIYLKETSKS